MPVAKSYTRAQWDELVRSLESLPVKPEAEQRLSIADAMKEMRLVIGAVRKKGYTLEEIVEHARKKGVDFSVGSVKYGSTRSVCCRELRPPKVKPGPQPRYDDEVRAALSIL
ncbi:hypothetical protein [Paraburkholderia sp. UYCP14C]|uniref:hypothetical protein n=1 Tax=Paraburkholderia sp. UYCP14C TaxID=2511130 RepID=UPI00200714A4|nr:hypothetical protein [Paraburkholderia sp. UYCP14C]